MNSRKSILLILIIGFLTSLASTAVVLYLRRDAWLPQPPPIQSAIEASGTGSKQAWVLRASRLQDLAREFEEKELKLRREAERLDLVRARIGSEREDLDRLRSELEEQLAGIESIFTRFAENERRNIRSLARIYTEMAPGAVALIFREIDESLSVKILSQLPQENAGGILEEMTRLGGEDARRAAVLTTRLRTLVVETTP